MRRIAVVPYDPAWPGAFASEQARLQALLGEQAVAIHHIGSTAVPGLAAKPTMDILVEVGSLEAIDRLTPLLEAQGYAARGENGITGRRYFVVGTPEVHTVHVHMFVTGNPEVTRHMAFRDYLRCHPEDAGAYARLKRRLAREHETDPGAYTEAKATFVREIDHRAALWTAEAGRAGEAGRADE